MEITFPKPIHKNVDVLIIAGEHSGDEHAATMIAGLKAQSPQLNIVAIGGPSMQQAGAQLLINLVEKSVVGLVEVLRNYGFFKELFKQTLAWIWKYRPRVVCFVDYPGFNLRLAKKLYIDGLAKKAGGDVTLCYYISPQIWAWKAKRRFEMAKWLNALAVIFPFEVDCYKDTSLPTTFVGHPFMDPLFKNTLKYDAKGPVLLLPGSRKAAVKRILPIMLKAFALHLKKYPNDKAVLLFPSQEILEVETKIIKHFPTLTSSLTLHSADQEVTGKALLGSSGTMSLKCALAAIPGAILYKAHPLTYAIGRLVVDIDRLGMANILLQRFVYPEYIQGDATAKNLANELDAVVKSPQRSQEILQAAQELEKILTQSTGLNPAAWLKKITDGAVWG